MNSKPFLFVDSPNTQAHVKAGFLGFQGSGKSHTSTMVLAAGLIKLGRERGFAWANKPILFFDTETGSDWFKQRLLEQKISMLQAKSRSFAALTEAIPQAADHGAILIIDSVTHVWRDFCDAYKEKKRRTRLEFQDWDELKGEWGRRFTTPYINVPVHAVINGRAGYEYDREENERGKMELVKTGVKMKVEGEMGYEPSLLCYMEREADPKDLARTVHVCNVLKDRSDRLDGKSCADPTFEFFLPHIESLALGGTHLGVDTTSRTGELFDNEDGTSRWRHEKKQAEIAIEEIEAELVRKWPGQGAVDKIKKAEMVEHLFGTRSWTAVQSKPLSELQAARDLLWMELRGHHYGESPDTPGVPAPLPPAAAAAAQAREDSLPDVPAQL